MRKIILNVAVSLDGFIEGSNREIDWCFVDQDYGMTDFLNRIDTICLGRRSYELLIQTSKNPFPDKMKYVFSKTMKNTKDKIHIINQDVEKEVNFIKNQAGKDIWLFGGAGLVTTFMNCGLVDEIQLAVHPLLLGQGKPLFLEIKKKFGLKLFDIKKYSTGLVQIFYGLVD